MGVANSVTIPLSMRDWRSAMSCALVGVVGVDEASERVEALRFGGIVLSFDGLICRDHPDLAQAAK